LSKPKHLVITAIIALFTQAYIVPGVMASVAKAPINILIMVSDDQRWDEFGLVQAEQGDKARFPFIKTPRLDALAAQGMRFRNAFVTTSLCSPSRSAILTGQYNHTNGIIDNFTPFSPRPTWATALQAAGYTTAYIGKWHHGEEQWDRPGFDFVATYQGHGQYNDTVFRVTNKWFDTKKKGYVDERSVEFAIEFLEAQPRDKPFAMMVGFKAVHEPFTPMAEHAQNYASDTIQPPQNWQALPPWSDLKQPMPWRRPPPAPNVHKDILRTVDGLDKNVGRMLDALNELDLAKNTLVIFTSDNGYYLGEHRQGDKRSAYDESIRVPLIMRHPGVIEPGTVSDAMVLNIDLAPTILDMAIQNVPTAMQGQSMRPLFGASPAPWREAFLYEYWQEHEWGMGSAKPSTPTILAVRTATPKLITYPGYDNWTELFDLRADPAETRNLIGYTRAKKSQGEMCNLLRQILVETDYIPRQSVNRWLMDFNDPYVAGFTQAAESVAAPRPPVMQPHC
jgi:arylsulfatase A-like enzyme